jgi:hypothetical protein
VLAGTPNGLPGEGGPGEAVAAGSAATVAAFDAPLAAGPRPLLHPATAPLAAITARAAVTAAWRRRAAAASPRMNRVTDKNSVLSAAHVQFGANIQKA